jgi:hypothetical protein
MKKLSGEDIVMLSSSLISVISEDMSNDDIGLLGDVLTLMGAALTAIFNRNAFLEQNKKQSKDSVDSSSSQASTPTDSGKPAGSASFPKN